MPDPTKTTVKRAWLVSASLLSAVFVTVTAQRAPVPTTGRERISINDGWRFMKDDPPGSTVSLLYDVRPDDGNARDNRPADAEPEKAVSVPATVATIKRWILPTGNPFIKDPAARHQRPS